MKCVVPNVTWMTKYSAVRKPDRQKRQKTVLDAHDEGSSLIQTDLRAANSVASLSLQMNKYSSNQRLQSQEKSVRR